MHDAVKRMLDKYQYQSSEQYLHALREILQEIALLGLWRSKFFDKAAFYGGTALRVLYGLDRFSEDMDFSLLKPPTNDFRLSTYKKALLRELEAFGFDVKFESVSKNKTSAVQSAFLKAETRKQLLTIETGEEIVNAVPKGKLTKIRLEIDTNPPPGFATHTRFLLQPIPFAVRAYKLPDLFAGKMHAVLCRDWKGRVKGRDWYDLVWYASHYPQLNLAHLENRMRQTGHWADNSPLSPQAFLKLLSQRIDGLNIDQAHQEVAPFVADPEPLSIWSHEFFHHVAGRIIFKLKK